MAGASDTIVGGITAGYNSTWLQVIGNHVVVGSGNAMSFGIQNRGVMGIIADNKVYEAPAAAGMSAGTLTVGIDGGEATFVAKNIVGIANHNNAIETTGLRCVENYASNPTGGQLAYEGSTS